MSRNRDKKHVSEIVDAYQLLMKALSWERDRWLKLAAALAESDQEKAREILDRQAEYIREQAVR